MADESPHVVSLTFSLSLVLADEAALPDALRQLGRHTAFFRAALPFGGPASAAAPRRFAIDAPAADRGGWEVVRLPDPPLSPAAAAASAAAAPAARPPSAAKGKADPKAAAKGGAPAVTVVAAAADATPHGPLLLRHTTTVSGLSADLALARAIDATPLAVVVMGVRPDESSAGAGAGGVAAAPTKGTKADPKAAIAGAPASAAAAGGLSAPGVRPFVLFLPLDCSPLLANAGGVGCSYGDAAAALAAIGPSAAAVAAFSAAGEELPAPQATDLERLLGCPLAAATGLPPLPAPALFSFMHLGVRVSAATQQQSAPAQKAAPAHVDAPAAAAAAAAPAAPAALAAKGKGKEEPKAKAAAPAASSAAAPAEPAAPSASVVDVTPPRLLSAALLRRLNPLTLSLGAADGLPGLAPPRQAGGLLGHDQGTGFASSHGLSALPDAYELQRRHCRPTFALLRLPELELAQGGAVPMAGGSLPASSASSSTSSATPQVRRLRIDDGGTVVTLPCPRACTLVSSASAPGPRAALRLLTVLCCGLMPAEPLREALHARPAVLELHDRDCLAYEELQRAARDARARDADRAAGAAGAVAAPAPALAPAAASAAPRSASSPPTSAGGKRPPAAASAAAPASASAPAPSLAALVAALVPVAWPWPMLPASRVEAYEGMLSGLVAWPPPASEPGAAAAAAVAAAAAAAAAPAAAPSAPAPAPAPVPSPAPAKGKAAPAPAAAGPPPSAASARPPASAPSASASPSPALFAPCDAFDVDELLCAEALQRAAAAGEAHAHAVALFKLDGLLDRHPERLALLCARFARAGAGASAAPQPQPLRLALSAGLSSSNRRLKPKVPEPLHLLSRAQALVSCPTDYAATGAMARLRAELMLPHLLHDAPLALAPHDRASSVSSGAAASAPASAAGGPPFERLVLSFAHSDANDDLLQSVLSAIERVNARALPAAPAAGGAAAGAGAGAGSGQTTRAYVLTAAQAAAAESGALDVVTGVHVIDGGVRRILLLEGLAEGDSMRGVRAAIGEREGLNAPRWRLLSNPAVRFHRRLYTAFGLAPKNIRLRAPLDETCASPVLYDVQRVAAPLRDALIALRQLVGALPLPLMAAPGFVAPSYASPRAAAAAAAAASAAALKGGDDAAPPDDGTLSMAHAKEAGAWPSAAGLLEVENKFGDTVSLAEMWGHGHPAAHSLEQTRGRLAEALGLVGHHVDASLQSQLLLMTSLRHGGAASLLFDEGEAEGGGDGDSKVLEDGELRRTRAPRTYLKGTTSSHNPEYVAQHAATQRARLSADAIANNVARVDAASAALVAAKAEELVRTVGPERAAQLAALERGRSLDTQGLALPGGQVYAYSGQRLNTGEWAQDLMRRRLEKDPHATFTRGPDFGSLTVSLVDAERDARDSAAASKAAWKTREGFVYPPNHSWAEDTVHPRRPPQAQVDALAKPWVDPNLLLAEERARRLAASTLPGHPQYRGGYVEPQPLKSTRESFGFLAADNSQQMLEFLTSVHPTGDVLLAQQQEDRAAAEAEFARKVVTDGTRFRYFESHDGQAKLNRIHSLLRDEPAKTSIRMIESGVLGKVPVLGKLRTRPSIKPLKAMPVSMDATLAFVVPPRDTALMRALEPAKFVGAASFKQVAPGDVIHGTAAAVYRPVMEASLRPTSLVGGLVEVPRLAQGINTDRNTRQWPPAGPV